MLCGMPHSSILGSAKQQGKNSLDVLIELLVTQDKSKILALVPPTRRTQARSSAALAETVLPARHPGLRVQFP